jgi:hypothetical protein
MSDEFPPDKRMLVLGAVVHELRGRVDRLDEWLRDTSEDSYATQNELRDEIAQMKQFIHRVEAAIPGGESVNLSRQIVDYGYDAEAAACDRRCGLEYVSDFECAKGVYEDCIWRIKPLIENLERVGIRVETGVIAIDPPEHFHSFAEELKAEAVLDAIRSPEKVLHRIAREAKENRAELAGELREAIVVAQLERGLLQETSCDWCGADVQTTMDHQTVDRAPMCNPCHDEYFPESADKEPTIKPVGFIGKDILAVERKEMNDTQVRSQNVLQQDRIEQLESWIQEVISKPSMSREMRLQGLELVQERSSAIRLAVERICPSQSHGLE